MITATLRRPRGSERTIHVVVPPTNLARGIGLDVCWYSTVLPVFRQRLSIRMAYGRTPFAGETRPCSCESSTLRDLFAVNVRTRTRTYIVLLHVLAILQRATASLAGQTFARKTVWPARLRHS